MKDEEHSISKRKKNYLGQIILIITGGPSYIIYT